MSRGSEFSTKFQRWLVVLTLAFMIARMFIAPRLTNIPTITASYEAFAHMLDGFLILIPYYDPKEDLGPSKTLAVFGWVFALWELGWFIIQKLHVL